MNVIFLGPPGSGKGTQAARLAKEKGLLHISTGDVFRDAISGQTELGKEIKAFVDAGKLVPDDLVSRVVFEKLKGVKGGFLLDGYPRTVDQAKAMDDFSRRNSVPVDAVVSFDVDLSALTKRLSSRRQCGKCKEVYNLEVKPPKVADKCDLCGEALVHRKDDQPEVIKERLRIYTLQTEPIIAHYKGRKEFHAVNAAQEIDAVYADLLKALS